MRTEFTVPDIDDRRFEALAARFLAEYLDIDPVAATSAGEHRHDDRWPDMGPHAEARQRGFIARLRRELDTIPVDHLNEKNRVDRGILANRLDQWQFQLDQLREWENNPLHYTNLIGDGLDPLVTRDFAPPKVRMASLASRLQKLPAIVDAACTHLKRPPAVHTETAIQQVDGLLAFVQGGMEEPLSRAPGMRSKVNSAAAIAAAALRDFRTFLKNDLLPRSDGDFRLGRPRFEKKLALALEADTSPDEIVAGARALMAATQEVMEQTARELHPQLFDGKSAPPVASLEDRKALIRAVLAKLAEDRPDDRTIVADAKKLTDEATEFVRQHDLVSLPKEPCSVIEMPEYRRGVAVAYCDSSGPLEEKKETFFAISPTPKDWPAKRVESFYREYSRPMLAELVVHEAMPGHYVQIAHANAFDSDVRAVFSNGPFVEGWAVYSEWVMAQHGFGGPRVRMMRQKMVLRLCANAILDHEVHAGSLDEKDALALMTNEAFQEEGEAVGKWKRARLTSAQLTTYYYGFTELMKLRREAEQKPGFSEKAFHDRMLAFGSPAPKYVRNLLGL